MFDLHLRACHVTHASVLLNQHIHPLSCALLQRLRCHHSEQIHLPQGSMLLHPDERDGAPDLQKLSTTSKLWKGHSK